MFPRSCALANLLERNSKHNNVLLSPSQPKQDAVDKQQSHVLHCHVVFDLEG